MSFRAISPSPLAGGLLIISLLGCAGEGWLLKSNDSSGDSGVDDCPDDPDKTAPGVCGCGTRDLDADQDGIMDCVEPAGWTDLRQYLVPSDGSHSLGDTSLEFNDTGHL